MLRLFKKDVPAEIEVTISNKTVIRVVLVVLSAVLFLAAVRQAQHAIILLFTAFFLSLALNAPVQWLSRHLPGRLRGKRAVATAVSFLIVVLLLFGFFASIVPPLVKNTQSFINAAPGLVESAHDQDSSVGQIIRRYHLENQFDTVSVELGNKLKNAGGSALTGAGKVGSSIFATLTILVLTFMMLIEGPTIIAFAHELVPIHRRKNTDRLARDMYRVVKGYVNGQVTLAAIASLLIVPAFFILHISYPVALMVVVFICGLIPMVGHTIGAIIVTLVALATSPVSAIIILAYYIFYQQVENYVVQPRIQANSTNMSPLLVFVSVIIGVSFGGLFGGLFAIPIAGCIRILILDYLKTHEYLGNKPVVAETAAKAEA